MKNKTEQSLENGQRYQKTPLIIGMAVVAGSLIYLVYKNAPSAKKPDSASEPSRAAVIAPPDNQEEWFSNSQVKLEDVVNNDDEEEDPPKRKKKPKLSEAEKKFQQQILSEATRSQLEMVKFYYDQQTAEQQAQYSAERSAINVQLSMPGVAGVPQSATGSPAPGVSGPTNGEGSGGGQDGRGGDQNGQSLKSRFVKGDFRPGEYLPYSKQKPISSYEIKAGTVIPAALITGLNSDLPGAVVSQVAENVYDTVTGNFLLIPQGAKLIGVYDSQVTYGQARALVVWTRLMFPDGSTIFLDKMQGVDVSGYAGFSGQVDYHYAKIFGNALLLSLVGAESERLAIGGASDASTVTVNNRSSQPLTDSISNITEKNLNIQPTLTVAPGYKFNVMVMNDLILEPLRGPDESD
ncbi:MAG: hypothetical protein HQL23_05890 [Candidatus Omnitrophica bacterium]|nr:hypothetical protein [Candidatus Omnitrophota bacterium]